MTQAAVSRFLETDRSNIANYETGKRLPPLESLIKIAGFFNVSLDYLVHGKKESESKGAEQGSGQRELMAENTYLMENELKLNEIIREKDEEIQILKDLVKSLRSYNEYLERKINEQTRNQQGDRS